MACRRAIGMISMRSALRSDIHHKMCSVAYQPQRLFSTTKYNYYIMNESVRGTMTSRIVQKRGKPTVNLAERRETTGYVTDLPRLGVPSLEETVDKLLRFAKVVQSPEDFKETQAEAVAFLKDENARKLQDLLQQRALRLDNWLTPWWVDVAYLAGRDPLPIVTSPGLTMAFYEFEGESGQLEYAAKVIQTALDFKKLVDEKALKQDGGATPFDMSQFDNLYGTTRIPRPNKDILRYGRDSPNRVNHIIVTRNGHSFRFPVFSKSGQPLGLQQIVHNLKKYVIPASQERNPEPINLLSAGDRETWAPVYMRMAKNNAAEIEAFEDALFVLCLDNAYPISANSNRREANMQNALHGCGYKQNTANRWFDKCLQFYVNTNGALGLCYEHTPAEGPAVAGLLDYVQDRLKAGQFNYITDNCEVKPIRLNWRMTELDRSTLYACVDKNDDRFANLEVRSLEFEEFGKKLPKDAHVSPDSFIQMALQCAYYRLHGTVVPTYETATLRKFKDGRTDTIRLPNAASLKAVEALASPIGRDSVAAQCSLLVQACDAHKQYANEASNGKGIDRHILGWKMIAAEEGIELPQLLQGAALRRLLRFQISTSQVPTKNELHLGFGPSELDGYGICYNPREDRIYFTITAYHSHPKTSAKMFKETLVSTLRDLRQVFVDSGRLQTKSKL
ncbi:unnamed protein product [Bursaphelenchus okinawaensis]|uniref:Choline/carnitine acyltransferase domain-containing protein n=1 Tax=Bursaphelenchus okinawaensis TaxID=465554 RepID=A0A811LJY5_9BILA|nr:unnamed protein product [Bursaphelenchus okinawaensis]CAG9123854.1 unnamed protein product [Bursaphelenchus okinawaensis]